MKHQLVTILKKVFNSAKSDNVNSIKIKMSTVKRKIKHEINYNLISCQMRYGIQASAINVWVDMLVPWHTTTLIHTYIKLTVAQTFIKLRLCLHLVTRCFRLLQFFFFLFNFLFTETHKRHIFVIPHTHTHMCMCMMVCM